MQIGRIPGATRVIGKSQGYLGLPVLDQLINCTVGGPETPSMVTAWLPTVAEIAAIGAGAAVHVRLLGNAIAWTDGRSHPPIMVEVGKPPDRIRDETAFSENGLHRATLAVVTEMLATLRDDAAANAAATPALLNLYDVFRRVPARLREAPAAEIEQLKIASEVRTAKGAGS